MIFIWYSEIECTRVKWKDRYLPTPCISLYFEEKKGGCHHSAQGVMAKCSEGCGGERRGYRGLIKRTINLRNGSSIHWYSLRVCCSGNGQLAMMSEHSVGTRNRLHTLRNVKCRTSVTCWLVNIMCLPTSTDDRQQSDLLNFSWLHLCLPW